MVVPEVDPIDLSQYKDLNTKEIEEVVNDQLIVSGIWESSKQGQALFRDQQEQVTANLAKSTQLEKEIATFQRQRAKFKSLDEQLDVKLAEWQAVEAEMNSALLPFTAAGVKSGLEKLVLESKDICDALEQSFLSDKCEDLAPFLKEYEQQQYLKHIRKLKLDSL